MPQIILDSIIYFVTYSGKITEKDALQFIRLALISTFHGRVTHFKSDYPCNDHKPKLYFGKLGQWKSLLSFPLIEAEPRLLFVIQRPSSNFLEILKPQNNMLPRMETIVKGWIMDPDIEQRFARIETDIKEIKKKPKDRWDKLAALAPFLSGVMIGVIGIYATSTYNARQLEMQALQKEREFTIARVQTVEKFFPHLSSTDDKVREAALDAVAVLGEQQLALKFAALFGGRSGATVLAKLANSTDPSVADPASSALAAQFDRLRSVVATVKSGVAESTGFFISADGLLIAPSFIIPLPLKQTLSSRVTIQLPSSQVSYQAEVLYTDEGMHLAMIKVALDRPVVPVQAWNTKPELGEYALVFAYARGSVWVGKSGRVIAVDVQDPRTKIGRIATDITSEAGFAGAPVVDISGRLLGMAESRDAAGNTMVINAEIIQAFAEKAHWPTLH